MRRTISPGDRFGKLTVITLSEDNEDKRKRKWLCVCDCGNETKATQRALFEGTKKSCGCLIGKNTYKDLTGKKFGMLTVLERIENRKNHVWYKCICDCGNYKIADAARLKSGETWNCGCKNKNSYIHGYRNTRLYRTWIGMKTRCFNPNTPFYKHYGGRGITVCEEWTDSENGFQNFAKWAIANGWDENKSRIEQSIDRIDVNGNYEPSNCRFADMKTQRKNQRPKNK